ncbi:MAG: aminotransferase class I/II-fold pyridoxal phosphate-dependent enzyme [Bacteroidetes bacterium]|nr:aminotransferase class I/II-fold pyridoxal phosphate-dependent enzyme [Bacteroidota bacterium]
MNPLATGLNETIESVSPAVYQMLSELGRALFFPKGILTQSAEAKEKAHKYNATIGIAIENGEAMHLKGIHKYFNDLEPNDVYPYAKPAGRPGLRKLWAEKIKKENPSTQGKNISEPIVTSALTHGLSVVADIFMDEGDVVISPDKLWGNYRLTFCTRRKAEIVTYPLFKDNKGFNIEAFDKTIGEQAKKKEKLIIMLNFPNNPTGYTPSVEEALQIYSVIKKHAEQGTKIVTVSDDAYFGLFFEDSLKESLFGGLCNLHENVLAIKLDGSTKEQYVWGFRTGFITFGSVCQETDKLYLALEAKVKGIIRGTISSCTHSSQTIVEKYLQDPSYETAMRQKWEVMNSRAQKLKSVLSTDKYNEAWEFYPFNSGYFMCFRMKKVNAETLRVHLLDKYGVGTISVGEEDLRVAFSCIEADQIEELVEIIFQGAQDLS